MKKNNTAEKTIRDAEKITKALKEGTENVLRDIMNEAISNIVMEGCNEDEDEVEDNSYEVEDVKEPESPAVSDEVSAEEGEFDAAENEEGPKEGDDEWSDWEDKKIGDDDYDFTGVNGDEVLKVFNKLGDDDQIFVKKEDDGTYSVKDDETGAEFVIELDPDAEGGEADSDNSNEMSDDSFDFENGEEGFDGEGSNPDEEFPESNELGDEGDNFGSEGDEEIEIDLGDDEDELNEENLGYTDSYQKDVFDKKFNMSEPADSKATYSMDGGAPEGANKPWAGKGNMKPFEKSVNECGDGMPLPNQDTNLEEDGQGLNTKHSMRKSTNRLNKDANNQKLVSEPANGYVGNKLSESVKQIIAKAKLVQEQNKKYAQRLKVLEEEAKQYEKCVETLKKSVYEAAVLNVNEGNIIRLLVNETLTKDEKRHLCDRFNNVKTIAEGKTLYNTIKSELNEVKKSVPTVEKQFVAESRNLNETTIYQNVNDPSLDLMNRMDNLSKK